MSKVTNRDKGSAGNWRKRLSTEKVQDFMESTPRLPFFSRTITPSRDGDIWWRWLLRWPKLPWGLVVVLLPEVLGKAEHRLGVLPDDGWLVSIPAEIQLPGEPGHVLPVAQVVGDPAR